MAHSGSIPLIAYIRMEQEAGGEEGRAARAEEGRALHGWTALPSPSPCPPSCLGREEEVAAGAITV